MDLEEYREQVDALTAEFVGTASTVSANEIGLDIRCGKLLISDEWIGVHSGRANRQLQYYGGFEYVDEEDVFVVGSYTFYSSESSRVQGHIDRWLNVEEPAPETDA